MRTGPSAVMLVVLLGLGLAYFVWRPAPEPEPAPRLRPQVWSLDMRALRRIAISLPRQGASEAWIRHPDELWYFDEPGGPAVSAKRWGGAIPLLLSGPQAEAVMSGADAEALRIYGLDTPRMKISLAAEGSPEIDVDVGDRTPDGRGYYLRRSDSNVVHLVDRVWYDVLEELVTDPPYP